MLKEILKELLNESAKETAKYNELLIKYSNYIKEKNWNPEETFENLKNDRFFLTSVDQVISRAFPDMKFSEKIPLYRKYDSYLGPYSHLNAKLQLFK